MNDLAVTIIKTGATVAAGAASASVALPTDNSGGTPKFCRITATASAYVKLTKGAGTAAAGDMMVQPGDAVIVRTWGMDTVSAIEVTAAGTVQISPMEDN